MSKKAKRGRGELHSRSERSWRDGTNPNGTTAEALSAFGLSPYPSVVLALEGESDSGMPSSRAIESTDSS